MSRQPENQPYPTFFQLFALHAVEGDVEATVKAICEALDLNDAQRTGLWQPLLHSTASRLRDNARTTERRLTPRLSIVKNRPGRPVSLTFAQELLTKSFSLDNTGKRYVTWGTATIAHHRERVQMLQVLRVSVQATIDQHEAAIAAITQAGVTCLQEIPQKKVAS